jgi:hypothetical protein
LAFLDQIPDGAVVAIRQRHGGAAIATADRPVVARRQIAMLVDAPKISDRDIGQVRHMPYLMAKAAGDLVQHP